MKRRTIPQIQKLIKEVLSAGFITINHLGQSSQGAEMFNVYKDKFTMNELCALEDVGGFEVRYVDCAYNNPRPRLIIHYSHKIKSK